MWGSGMLNCHCKSYWVHWASPFVLCTKLSELDFWCPTCKHTVKLHQLPLHQESCIQSPTTAPTHIFTPSQRSVPVTPSPLAPVKPIPAAEEERPARVNVPSLQAELTTTTDTNKTCREQLTVNQLLTSPKEAYTSLKEEVGLFIIRQFLSQSQDGETILLKTGGQLIKYFEWIVHNGQTGKGATIEGGLGKGI